MKTAIIATAAALLFVSAPVLAQYCDEEVVLTTQDGTIFMHHSEAEYNCCSCVYTEVVQNGFEIDFLEREDFSCGVCYCLCCSSIDALISGLDPGSYTVRVWKIYGNGDEYLAGTWTIDVTGYSEPSVWSAYVPCSSLAVPEGPVSWGVVKALYK